MRPLAVLPVVLIYLDRVWRGARIVEMAGGRLAGAEAAGRNLIKGGPFLVLGLGPGGQLISVVWLCAHLVVIHRSPVNQALHDRLVSTWVAAPEATTQLHLA
jgi:hypothetical protein